MKIYTGSGDKGRTGLFSGERVSKSHDRIEALGGVDELNAILGMLLGVLHDQPSGLIDEIKRIQSDLLHTGACIATAPGSPSQETVEEISEEKCRELEAAIDRMEETLPELKGFILPGGHISAAWAHIARTVCRRAERQMVRLISEESQGKVPKYLHGSLIYLNRLSDYLFVLARYCNHLMGVPDTYWKI